MFPVTCEDRVFHIAKKLSRTSRPTYIQIWVVRNSGQIESQRIFHLTYDIISRIQLPGPSIMSFYRKKDSGRTRQLLGIVNRCHEIKRT